MGEEANQISVQDSSQSGMYPRKQGHTHKGLFRDSNSLNCMSLSCEEIQVFKSDQEDMQAFHS